MTRRLLSLIVLISVIAIAAVFVLIPPYVKIYRQVKVYTPEQAVIKYVMHTKKWSNWLPNANRKFIVQKSTISEITGRLLTGNDTAESTVGYAVRDGRTIYLTWNAVVRTGVNPLKRVLLYQSRNNVVRRIDSILANAKQFLEDDRQVYGIHVQNAKIEDSIVLATKRMSKSALPLEEVYKAIKELRAYAVKTKADKAGYPMMNVTQLNTKAYLTTLAIPINKPVSSNNDFFIKKLVYNANLLTVNVKGGNSRIKTALNQLSLYMLDNGYTSPAIPYEELVTDRVQTPDSSKWITRICYPVL
ncbi:hypothetical protein KHS38_01195 [Mucilaginibacter sp. Bleaf8]|uniref:hypothetical protein n=1 Tax=Mucilaginibacter sp. Bleaf8 TaxID=2834430 RepID=UPI001BCD61E1|nr:hypothetical protein [Mucilaginibacter sp. Bleaf8]MBS7563005.1 hypothetical protein [Mucilaginibacter sp. Bleaf8]